MAIGNVQAEGGQGVLGALGPALRPPGLGGVGGSGDGG